MRRQPTPQNIQNYRRLHAAAKKIHKLAKRTAWRNYISKIYPKAKPKDIWRIIKNIKGIKTTKRSHIIHNNRIIHDIKIKAELFVNYLQGTMNKQNNYNYTHEDIQLIDNTANNFQNEIYNQRFTMHEMEHCINTLKKQIKHAE